MNLGIFNMRGISSIRFTEHFIKLELDELRKQGHEVELYWARGKWPSKEDVEWMDFAIYHFVPTAIFFHKIGIPYCILPTANDIFPNNGKNLKIIEQDKNCKFIGYQSFYHKKKYEEWGITKPTVYIPHCVRTELFKRETPYNSSGKKIAGGRLILKKGLDRLKNVENLTIFGDGPLMEDLKSRLKSTTRFTGFLAGEKLKDLFEESRIYLFPAIVTSEGDSDGIANSVKEAMLMELPVITSSVAGMGELENVIHLNNWAKINDILNDNSTRQRNYKGRQEILKTYSPNVCVNMLLKGIKDYNE